MTDPGTLAGDKRISMIVFQILAVAQAGGMSEEIAESTYDRILQCYTVLNAEAANDLIADIHTIIENANDPD